MVLFSAILFLIFSESSSGGGTFNCNASLSEGDGGCFAFIGGTVVLTCIPPERARDVEILQGDAVAQRTGWKYTLDIRDLEAKDSGLYTCRWNFAWYDLIGRIFYEDEIDLRLHVIKREMNECTLVNGFDGVFFVGQNVEFFCPVEIKLGVELNSTNGSFNVNVTDKLSQEMKLVRTNAVSALYNNSKLVCNAEGKTRDYCESFPTIIVYDDLEVTVYPQSVEVNEGQNITLTCRSFPAHTQSLVEWDLSEIQNHSAVSLLNVTHSIQGSRNLTLNFQHGAEALDQYVIKCIVILGSKNKTKKIKVIPHQQSYTTDVTITSGVSTIVTLTLETIDKSLERKEQNEKKEERRTDYTIIIIPVVVLLLTSCGIIGLIFICRRTKRNISKTETRESSIDVPNSDHHGKNEMQLPRNESEIVRNIIYEPYTAERL